MHEDPSILNILKFLKRLSSIESKILTIQYDLSINTPPLSEKNAPELKYRKQVIENDLMNDINVLQNDLKKIFSNERNLRQKIPISMGIIFLISFMLLVTSLILGSIKNAWFYIMACPGALGSCLAPTVFFLYILGKSKDHKTLSQAIDTLEIIAKKVVHDARHKGLYGTSQKLETTNNSSVIRFFNDHRDDDYHSSYSYDHGDNSYFVDYGD